jgi:hypothetical protein
MGTRIEATDPQSNAGQLWCSPSSVFDKISLAHLGQDGFISVHFACTLKSKVGLHLFPQRCVAVHNGSSRIDEYGMQLKCQQFPIFGRKDLTNHHCAVHELYNLVQRYRTDDHLITALYQTTMNQAYSDSSHMFSSRRNQMGSVISEDQSAAKVLPKNYKGGGGGNRCPFIDYPILR